MPPTYTEIKEFTQIKKQKQKIHNLRPHLKSNHKPHAYFADFSVYLLGEVFILIHLSYSQFNFPSLNNPSYNPTTNYGIFKSLCDQGTARYNVMLT